MFVDILKFVFYESKTGP